MLSPGLLTLWTRLALTAARTGDADLAAETAWRIAAQSDALDLAAACRVIADAALKALLVLYGPPAADRGEAWVLDQLGDAEGQPPRLFAARLLTAYANRDHDTVSALAAAAAAASPVERAESLQSLITYAAGLEARAARHTTTEGISHDDRP